jgi:hypothetical protein
MEETPSVPATPDTSASRPVAWTSAVLLSATLTLAVFNARSAPVWIAAQEPTPANLRLHDLAQSWEAATSRVGLDRPGAAVRALWARRRALKLGEWRAAGGGASE